VNRRFLAASILSAACLTAAAPAVAEDLLLLNPAPVEDWGTFDGPYLGVSLGYGQGSPNITAVVSVGRNFYLTDSIYWGADLTGIIYNDGTHKDSYMLSGKLGTSFGPATVYGMAGVGIDTNVSTIAWRATAGAEYLLTDSLGINAELSSTQGFTSFGDVIQGQLGFRFHYDKYRGDGPSTFDYANAGVLQSMDDLGNQIGLEEVRFGGALSNLELNPVRMPFEPDLGSFAKARPDMLQFDVIMRSPELFAWIGGARPSLGGVINLQGYESMVHAGLNWKYELGESPVFIEAGLGLGIHNGYLSGAPAGYRNLGCRTLVEWQYGAGYDVNDKVNITATWKHVSGYLLGCSPNDGINTFGVAAGWKF
jgi:lipid A 3-O-deacylase